MTAAVLDRTTSRRPGGSATGLRAARPRPRLRLLDPPAERRRRRRRHALVLLFFAVLVGFFGVAYVHAELVAGQHDLDAMRARISEADAHRSELARAVEEASAPDVIMGRAIEMGLVPAQQPVHLIAAAPLRRVEVASPAPAVASAPVTTVVETADPDLLAASDSGRGEGTPAPVSGVIGSAGGISAAVRLIDEPAPEIALGRAEVTASPAGTTASTAASVAIVNGTAAPVVAGATAGSDGGGTIQPATGGGALGGGPVSTLAGTRAVTAGASLAAGTTGTG